MAVRPVPELLRCRGLDYGLTPSSTRPGITSHAAVGLPPGRLDSFVTLLWQGRRGCTPVAAVYPYDKQRGDTEVPTKERKYTK